MTQIWGVLAPTLKPMSWGLGRARTVSITQSFGKQVVTEETEPAGCQRCCPMSMPMPMPMTVTMGLRTQSHLFFSTATVCHMGQRLP